MVRERALPISIPIDTPLGVEAISYLPETGVHK
jgi:hypothetical protein